MMMCLCTTEWICMLLGILGKIMNGIVATINLIYIRPLSHGCHYLNHTRQKARIRNDKGRVNVVCWQKSAYIFQYSTKNSKGLENLAMHPKILYTDFNSLVMAVSRRESCSHERA